MAKKIKPIIEADVIQFIALCERGMLQHLDDTGDFTTCEKIAKHLNGIGSFRTKSAELTDEEVNRFFDWIADGGFEDIANLKDRKGAKMLREVLERIEAASHGVVKDYISSNLDLVIDGFEEDDNIETLWDKVIDILADEHGDSGAMEYVAKRLDEEGMLKENTEGWDYLNGRKRLTEVLDLSSCASLEEIHDKIDYLLKN